MKKLLVPSALAVTLFSCGSPGQSDGGHDAGPNDAGNDAGTDGGSDGGCDCMNMCPPEACAAFPDGDGGILCECAI